VALAEVEVEVGFFFLFCGCLFAWFYDGFLVSGRGSWRGPPRDTGPPDSVLGVCVY
jgi:hypothetical protein